MTDPLVARLVALMREASAAQLLEALESVTGAVEVRELTGDDAASAWAAATQPADLDWESAPPRGREVW